MEEQVTPVANKFAKSNWVKKSFTFILVFSLILNVILFLKLNGVQLTMTGNSVLINPEMNKDLGNNHEPRDFILHYEGLKSAIQSEINLYGSKDNVGFFIQDLNTGSWTGKNEKVGFQPASLLKIPIMMAILKKVDRGELSLLDKVVIRQGDIDAGYPTIYEEKEGAEATIEQLLIAMITESDNTAKNVLARQLLSYELDDVFKHVGIPNPYIKENKNKTVSPRDYSRLFKALYYSTFLSPELSQFGLKLTTNTQVENLIPSGVPDNVIVAHKFGVYDEILLHDCGIVYHNKNPYVICVMTKNMNSAISANLIRKISSHTYEFVDKH